MLASSMSGGWLHFLFAFLNFNLYIHPAPKFLLQQKLASSKIYASNFCNWPWAFITDCAANVIQFHRDFACNFVASPDPSKNRWMHPCIAFPKQRNFFQLYLRYIPVGEIIKRANYAVDTKLSHWYIAPSLNVGNVEIEKELHQILVQLLSFLEMRTLASLHAHSRPTSKPNIDYICWDWWSWSGSNAHLVKDTVIRQSQDAIPKLATREELCFSGLDICARTYPLPKATLSTYQCWFSKPICTVGERSQGTYQDFHIKDIPPVYTGCPCLPADCGRHSRIPLQDRLCSKCSTRSLGDEYHLVFEC